MPFAVPVCVHVFLILQITRVYDNAWTTEAQYTFTLR